MAQNSKERKNAITRIIRDESVFSQEELQQKLKDSGFITTQATLSRDLKDLHIIKVPGEGYRLPNSAGVIRENIGQLSLTLEFSGQLAIIKTLPGYASAIAARIDSMTHAEIMGTLAGDDVVLIVIREGYTRKQVADELKRSLPSLRMI